MAVTVDAPLAALLPRRGKEALCFSARSLCITFVDVRCINRRIWNVVMRNHMCHVCYNKCKEQLTV